MTQAYPLQWPAGWRRTERPHPAAFKTPFSYARDNLLRELKLLGATSVVISSNMMVRQDGLLYAKQRAPDDRGVAVYFTRNGEQQCIPCDKWTQVQDNLQAIRLTVEALRGLERWGAKDMVNAAFRGFKALPESIIMGAGQPRAWYEVLQVSQDADSDIIRAAWKRLVAKYHPDNQSTGDSAKFDEVQRAYQSVQARRAA